MKGRVSAPGKVIVCGEHSAVYGHPVLAMAIDKRLECLFETSFDQKLRITVSNVEITPDSNETKLLEYLSSKITNPNKCHIHITIIKNEIIIGAGLGSSAAYAACLSASIVLSLSKDLNDDLIFDGTNYLEKLCHGKPSGCDAAVVITGGTIQYNLRPPPEFTSITPLTTNLKRLNMFVVYTGKPHDTK
jgi:mevalonate kinase